MCIGWPDSEGTSLYCDDLNWCVSCTAVVSTCLVMGACVCMCGCFGNVCTCITCVL